MNFFRCSLSNYSLNIKSEFELITLISVYEQVELWSKAVALWQNPGLQRAYDIIRPKA